MTDKEIIIDGVDVSGCDLLRYDYFPFDDKGYDTCSGTEISICSLKCKDNPNCYYKQLMRAEAQIAEDEELQCEMRQEIDKLTSLLEQTKPIEITVDYRQENEELKAQLETYISLHQIYKNLSKGRKDVQCVVEHIEELEHKNEELQKQLQSYKEDRFCQGGCVVYQYDKIHKLNQTLKQIEENITLARDLAYDSSQTDPIRVQIDKILTESLQKIEEII